MAKRWLVIFSFVLGCILAWPVLTIPLFDDAYIHIRIAENFLKFGVPIFNEGEIFKVGSSTGFVLLIALLSKFSDFLSVVRGLEFVVVVVTVMALAQLCWERARDRWKNYWVAACAIPYLLIAAYGGMETPIVCMLITFAALAWCRDQAYWVIFWLALCTWFRFEAHLLLVVVLVYYIWVGKKSISALGTASLPVVLLWTTDLYFFGTLIPHAAKVKSIAYAFPLWQSLANALRFGGGWLAFIFGCGVAIFLVYKVIHLVSLKHESSFADWLYLFPAGLMAAWVLGRSLIFPWYFALFTFPLGIAVLLSKTQSKLTGPWGNRVASKADWLVVFGLGILGMKAVLMALGIRGDDLANLRVHRYEVIGANLYTQCPTCDLVTSEIGGLGYAFKGRVHDAFGLGDPTAVVFHPMKVPEERQGYSVGAIPPGYVKARNPEFIVSMPIFSMALRKSGLLDQYHRYDCSMDPSGQLEIFGDKKIQIFSKLEITENRLDAMGCEEVSELPRQ